MVRLSKKIVGEIITKSFSSVIMLLLFFAAYLYYKINVIPVISTQAQLNIRKYIGTIFVICIGLAVQRIAEAGIGWYEKNIAARTKTKLDDRLVPIFRRTLKVIIWVLALLIILPFYGINITALVTALGVSSLAIALAAQDTIANIIAGFLIMIDTPFRVGDKIKIPSGEVVEVLDIGVRRSKFLAEDQSIIIVPNLDLSKSKIVNFTYGEERAAKS